MNTTNGFDINNPPPMAPMKRDETSAVRAVRGSRASFVDGHAMNIMTRMNANLAQNILLPPGMAPAGNLSTSQNVTQFFFLNDNKTGILALGSFDDSDFNTFEQVLLNGLMDLKNRGATQLIIDIVRCTGVALSADTKENMFSE